MKSAGRVIQRDDKATWACDQLAYRLIYNEHRYAEGLIEILKTARNLEEQEPEDKAIDLHKLAKCLDALGADAELSAVLDRLGSFPEGRARFRWLFPAAIRIGRLDLCEMALPQNPRHTDADGEPSFWEQIHAKDRIYQVYLRQGRVDDFRRALASDLMEIGLAQDPRLYSAYWPKTADIWAKRAEELLEDGPTMNIDYDYLLSAYAFQVDPDIAKFERAIERCEATTRKRQTVTFHRARLASLKGDYKSSLDWYEKIRANDENNRPWNRPWDVVPETEAVRFLEERAHYLAGPNEKWRRVLYAYKTEDGSRYLITRDTRIGKALPDGNIIDIPLPEPGWWPYRLADGLVVSTSGRTVLAVSREQVYQLKPDAAGWTPLMRIPFSQDGWALHLFAPWADELVAELQSHPPDGRSIILPEWFPDHNMKKPLEPVMLSDGTWLFFQAEPRRMINFSSMLAQQVGQRVQIFNCPRAERRGAFYLGTARGVYRWVPGSDRFEAIPLPGPNPAPPTMIVTMKLPSSGNLQPLAAVLPSHGGAMFEIDIKTQRVTPISCINEELPVAYWWSRPPAERIAEAKAMMQKVGLDWEALRPPISRPSK